MTDGPRAASSREFPGAGPAWAVEIEGLSKRYGDRIALDGLTLSARPGDLLGLLGPNGSGKSTLFRILATLLPASGGRARVFDHDVGAEPAAVRGHLGVVFQHPSLDGKLTVAENLRHHGRLFGLRGGALRDRVSALLDRFRLLDRARDRAEALSGGLRRRVELAKAMVSKPDLLLMDEPSTGLDPVARRDLMVYLGELRDREGVTILLTTHLLEEAERCDRVAILHAGRLVALGAPDELKRRLGGDVVTIVAASPGILREKLGERFGCRPVLVRGSLRLEVPRGHEFVREAVEAFPGEIRSVTFGRPTLEDVFVHLTGERLTGPAGDGA
jgi:ABC-2 type transport system ATP-binding protein